jgi:ABC-type dipeptide/oligopeptide/nickel transport system permease component
MAQHRADVLVVFVPLNQHGITWIQTGYAGPSQGHGTWTGHMILPWITLAAMQAAVYTRPSRGQVGLVYGCSTLGSGSPEAR